MGIFSSIGKVVGSAIGGFFGGKTGATIGGKIGGTAGGLADKKKKKSVASTSSAPNISGLSFDAIEFSPTGRVELPTGGILAAPVFNAADDKDPIASLISQVNISFDKFAPASSGFEEKVRKSFGN